MTILGLEGTKIYKIQNNLNLESLKTLVINDDIFGNIDTVTDTDTNKLIIEKYIELYIKHTTNKTNYFDEAYFTELKTNVNLINNRLLIDTENINEIDMTFFANKKIIEYIFLSNFLSNVYESKAKQALDYKNPNVGKITVKIRTVNSDIDNNDYISTYNYFKGREKKHSFIPINFEFQNAYRGNNYNSILADNISEEFEDSRENKERYKSTFERLLNKIDFKGKFLDLDSNLDYYKLLLLSYKYNLYSVLINYNIIQLYYAHIKFNSRDSSLDIIKYSEIYYILQQFNNVFKTNEYKFQQLDIIMNSVDKLEYKAESEKIQIAKEQMNKLDEINNTITKSRDNVNKNKEILITEKRDYNYNKYKIIIISVILLITFASYIISINYYSLETSKFLSLIVFVIVLTVLLFNYLIIKTTEHFEESEPVVTDETITSTSSSGIISYEELQQNINNLFELKEQSNLDIRAYQDTKDYGERENIYVNATSDPFQSLIQDSNLDDNIKTAAEATSNKTYQFKQVFDNLNSLIADAEREKINLEDRRRTISGNLKSIDALLTTSNADIQTLTDLYSRRKTYIDDLVETNRLLEGILDEKIDLKKRLIDEHDKIIKDNANLLNEISDLEEEESGNKYEQDRLDGIRLNLIANIETYNEEIGKLNEMIEIERPKLKILKGEIESKKEEYNKTSLELVDKMEEIAELESKIGNNSLTIQIIAKKIIDEKERLQKEADDSKIEADAAKLGAELAKEELEKKIAELEYQIENAPIPRTYELYFDLNSNIIDNQIKKENFKNQIITDLTLLLTITSNRFLIQNILPDEEKVKLTLIFYPSRTTGIEAIKSDILIDTLQVYFASENTNKFAKLINTTYLKFITKIIMLTQTGEPDKEGSFILDDQQNLMHVTGNINRLLSNNKNMLDGIKEIISRLELIETSPNTYYNEINPGIEKEVIKYTDIESQIDYNKNIFNSQINTLKHDNIDSFYIYKYISYITLLLSALFICYSYLNNYSLLIYIIFSIIFVIILFYLFLDIFKNVRRKPKNKYWEKPKYN